jgi:hypothetical protein
MKQVKQEELDTSYSGVVSYIDGNDETGRKLISKFIVNFIEVEEELIELEAKVSKLQSERNQLKHGISNIAEHLKKQKPFYVPIDSVGIVEVTKDDGIIYGKEIF